VGPLGLETSCLEVDDDYSLHTVLVPMWIRQLEDSTT
jgi:hypothetical protein